MVWFEWVSVPVFFLVVFFRGLAAFEISVREGSGGGGGGVYFHGGGILGLWAAWISMAVEFQGWGGGV